MELKLKVNLLKDKSKYFNLKRLGMLASVIVSTSNSSSLESCPIPVLKVPFNLLLPILNSFKVGTLKLVVS